MRTRTLWWLVFCSIVVTQSPLYAQELRPVPNRSTHLWMDVGVRGKITDRLRAYGDLGYRTGDELQRRRQFYLSGELRYKLHKYIHTGLEQRASFRANTPNRHRTGLMLRASGRVGRTTLEYRMVYQHIWRERGAVRDVMRYRFGAEYDIKGFQFDPEFSAEIFHAYRTGGGQYDAVRYKLGTGWRPAKGHRISFALVHDREQNRRRPDHRWIFAFGYAIDLGKVGG